MDKIVNKTVKLTLVGLNGNAYSLMGAFKRAAIHQGWTNDEIQSVITECMTGNYDHLLVTLMNHCEDKKEIEDE